MLTSCEIFTERFNIHPILSFVKYLKYPYLGQKYRMKKTKGRDSVEPLP